MTRCSMFAYFVIFRVYAGLYYKVFIYIYDVNFLLINNS